MQAGDAIGQAGRKHGQNAVAEVDACPASPGFVIEGRSRGYIMSYIGNVNAEPPRFAPRSRRAAGTLQRDGVVKIASIGVIDRENGGAGEVEAVSPLRRGDLARERVGLRGNLSREDVPEAQGANDGQSLRVWVAGRAEALDDRTDRVRVTWAGVAGDGKNDLLAAQCPQRAPANGGPGQSLVIRSNPGLSPGPLVGPDQGRIGSFEDLNNAAPGARTWLPGGSAARDV
jgi:hypothetical protein